MTQPKFDPDSDTALCVLLRFTYATVNEFRSVPGNTTRIADCGHRVMISPDCVLWLATDEIGKLASTVCSDCYPFKSLLDAAKTGTPTEIIPGSVAAVAGVLTPEEFSHMRSVLKRHGIEIPLEE